MFILILKGFYRNWKIRGEKRMSKKEMLVYRFERVVNAPIDVVFEYVDNDEKVKLWNTMIVENIYESEEDARMGKPGTKFKSVQKFDNKTFTVDCVMTEYDPPYKIVLHSESKEGIGLSRYFLSREYNSTRLVVEASLIPRNFLYKFTAKIFGKAAGFVFNEQFENLVRLIEEELDEAY
jgi:uncharacterized protein YndB with AHSA1/START domain